MNTRSVVTALSISFSSVDCVVDPCIPNRDWDQEIWRRADGPLAESLVMDGLTFTRTKRLVGDDDLDHGNLDYCERDNRYVLTIIVQKRNGLWVSHDGLGHWIGTEQRDTLYLSDGSKWVLQ